MEGGRKGEREGGREGERERGREGERERERDVLGSNHEHKNIVKIHDDYE